MSEAPEQDEAPAVAAPRAPRALKEALLVYGAVFLAVLALALAAPLWGALEANLYLIVAAVFLAAPYLVIRRRGLSFERLGLTTDRLGRGALLGLLAGAVTLLPFAAGQHLWETQVQGREARFDAQNWLRWPLEQEGAPQRWGEAPGVWAWLEQGQWRAGLRSEKRERVKLVLEAPRPFALKVNSPLVALKAVDERGLEPEEGLEAGGALATLGDRAASLRPAA